MPHQRSAWVLRLNCTTGGFKNRAPDVNINVLGLEGGGWVAMMLQVPPKNTHRGPCANCDLIWTEQPSLLQNTNQWSTIEHIGATLVLIIWYFIKLQLIFFISFTIWHCSETLESRKCLCCWKPLWGKGWRSDIFMAFSLTIHLLLLPISRSSQTDDQQCELPTVMSFWHIPNCVVSVCFSLLSVLRVFV